MTIIEGYKQKSGNELPIQFDFKVCLGMAVNIMAHAISRRLLCWKFWK